MNRTRPVSRPVLFHAWGTLRGKNAQVPGPPTLTSSPILKVISPSITHATSSLSRWRWKRLLVPAGKVSSNIMMLSLVSWPRSFNAAKRPGAPMSRCAPPPAGTTKPFVAFMLVSFPVAETCGPASLIEDGPRGEVQLGPAKQPRGHEQRGAADAEAGADQRLEQGSAGAGDAHR